MKKIIPVFTILVLAAYSCTNKVVPYKSTLSFLGHAWKLTTAFAVKDSGEWNYPHYSAIYDTLLSDTIEGAVPIISIHVAINPFYESYIEEQKFLNQHCRCWENSSNCITLINNSYEKNYFFYWPVVHGF